MAGRWISVTSARNSWGWVASFAVIYAVSTVWRAVVKPFWYDELFTYYLVRLGSLGRISEANASGVDLNPPLLYLATMAGQGLLGVGELGTRLPAIVGFAVMLFCVFLFVSHRLPAAFAGLAMALVALTGAYGYAYEARSYGMLLGFTGLALLGWQRRSLPWMTLSIAGGLLTHCYGVLILPPLALGQLVKDYSRKRIDWGVWISFAVSSLAVLTYLPILGSSRGYQLKGPIFDPTVWRLLASYVDILAPALWPVLATLGLAALLGKMAGGIGFEPYEMTAAIGLLCTPFAAFAMATAFKGGYFARYGLAAGIGSGILAASIAHALAGARLRWAWMLPALALAWFSVRFSIEWTAYRPAALIPEMAARSEMPLVAADGQTFLQLDRYLDDKTARRLVFVTDRDSALRYMGTDCYDRTLQIARPWFPLRGKLVSYQEFTREHRSYLVFGTRREEHHWILAKLAVDGAKLERRWEGEGKSLVEVKW